METRVSCAETTIRPSEFVCLVGIPLFLVLIDHLECFFLALEEFCMTIKNSKGNKKGPTQNEIFSYSWKPSSWRGHDLSKWLEELIPLQPWRID